jgi:hypothetical protein
MASINRLKPGQIVFSIERQRMGKTTIKRNFLFEVTIVGVNLEERYVMASWNGNTPKKFLPQDVKKWRVNRPEPKGKTLGHDTY